MCKFLKSYKFKKIIFAFTAVFSVAMSIWSFVSALNAYNALEETKGDYQDYIDHWDAQPITDVRLISPNDDCPNGYKEGQKSTNDRNTLQTVARFPGSQNWCDCKEEGFNFTYTYYLQWCDCPGSSQSSSTSPGDGVCDEDQRNDGCSSESQADNITVYFYTSKGACIENATIAGCATDAGLDDMAMTNWKGYKFCFQRNSWNAMDRLDYTDLDKNKCSNNAFTCQQASDKQDPTNTICADSEDECPIVMLDPDITMILMDNYTYTNMTNDSEIDLLNQINVNASGKQNYLPIVEIRTTIGDVCWTGSFGERGRSNNIRVRNKYSSSCKKADNRYEPWDSIDETTLYNDNDVPTSGNNLMGNNESSPIQYYNESSDVDWTISYRRQILWKSDCEAGDVNDLRDHLNPLREMVNYQYALLIVNGIFGLGILGILIPVVSLLHVFDRDSDLPCVPGKGEQEMNLIKKGSSGCSLTAKVAKLIPLILCLVVTDAVHSFFMTAGESDCSDPLTNKTMIEVAEQVDRVRDSNYMTLGVDIAMFVWGIVPFIINCFSKGKK